MNRCVIYTKRLEIRSICYWLIDWLTWADSQWARSLVWLWEIKYSFYSMTRKLDYNFYMFMFFLVFWLIFLHKTVKKRDRSFLCKWANPVGRSKTCGDMLQRNMSPHHTWYNEFSEHTDRNIWVIRMTHQSDTPRGMSRKVASAPPEIGSVYHYRAAYKPENHDICFVHYFLFGFMLCSVCKWIL